MNDGNGGVVDGRGTTVHKNDDVDSRQERMAEVMVEDEGPMHPSGRPSLYREPRYPSGRPSLSAGIEGGGHKNRGSGGASRPWR